MAIMWVFVINLVPAMELKPDIQLSYRSFYSLYEENFPYFKTLDSFWKNIFVLRCLEFVNRKMIIGAEGFTPNTKVKAMVSASAVQLTLGLGQWQLEHFDTIIIHPSDFDDKPTGLKFKGETNLQGHVRLSWRSFISGYRIADDNLNLGIHEFTHALRFNPIRGNDQDYFVEHYFNRWLAAANEAFDDIRNNRQDVFRKYGGTNINEFLSVCVEHYFESPAQIKEQYPMLYYCTAILLNQETKAGQTTVNIRQRLFSEKNLLSKPISEINLDTKFKNTSTFKIMVVVAVPLAATIASAGFFNAGALFLGFIMAMLYLRFDFWFTAFKIHDNRFYIRKGFLFFRNRSNLRFDLSQLISVKADGDNSITEWEVIYYNQTDFYFHEESFITPGPPSKEFIRQLLQNKVAVFIR